MATPSILGSYPIECELGRGGMGIVYLARDPRLNRQVAIKVLPDVHALNAARLARFEREARLLASLNHPHIAAIHGIEQVQERQLLILEYVPGETLADRLSLGPLPMDAALDICRQIALAMESAHDGGVIHRDLKPGNVKVTPDGQVKVLDFGLAKEASRTSSADAPPSSTITISKSGDGTVLGTAGYMSPEQARGGPTDRRTDIWSFGCLMFECLTGRQAFAGDTASDTIAKVLEREPDWTALPGNTPPRILDLLRRCLEKDVRKRQRDIGDARIDVEDAIAERAAAARGSGGTFSATTRASSPVWRRAALAFGLLIVTAVLGFAGWKKIDSARDSSDGGSVVRLSVAIPPGIHADYAGLTRDGSSVLLMGKVIRADGTLEPRRRLYIRALDEYDFKPMPGTDGAETYMQSHDGQWLAVLVSADETSPQRLVKVRVDGTHPPTTITLWDAKWRPSATWLPDGDFLILTGGSTEFVRVPGGGAPPRPAVKFDLGSTNGFPALREPLPDGRHVLMTISEWTGGGYSEDVWVLDVATGKGRLLLKNAGPTAVLPTGHLVFSRGEALMGAPFDLAQGKITGEETALIDGLRATTWDHGAFDVANNGTLLYAPGGRVGTDRRIVIVDAAGVVSPFSPERRAFEGELSASPDGRRVAVKVPNAGGSYEIWIADRDGAALRRVVTTAPADSSTATWSPDGQRLAFSRIGRDKNDGIYVQDIDGGEARPILTIASPEEMLFPTHWAAGGRLLFDRQIGVKRDILLLPLSASGEPGRPRTIRATAAGEGIARFSPNGRLVSFVSDDSGQFEAYVAAWRDDGSMAPPFRASTAGGYHPIWSSDGRRVFFVGRDSRVRSVTVQESPTLSVSPETTLFDLAKLRLRADSWDILADGRLLAVQNGEGEGDVSSYNVVVNWRSELLARMEGRAR